MARRLVERGTRFVQIFHEAWDQHGNLSGDLKRNCADTDRANAALIQDLKARGLLDDTLVIWGGDSRNDVFRSNKHVTELLSQEFVADICAWAGGTFTSLRAELTVFADGTTREATASVSEAEAHDSHKKGLT